MIYALSPDQSYYRVTILGRRMARGPLRPRSLYLSATGNRYNTVLQQAAYVCDDPAVAVTEFAYYAARNWQNRLGNHHVLPVAGPLQSDYVLWRFRLDQPTYVINVEPSACLGPFHRICLSIQGETTRPRSIWPIRPRPGRSLAAPIRTPDCAARGASRHGPTDSQVSYVLYRLSPAVPRGQLEGRWRLRIEFLDLDSNPVGAPSPRIDWCRPRFQLLPSPGGGAPPALPPGYALATWYAVHVNYT